MWGTNPRLEKSQDGELAKEELDKIVIVFVTCGSEEEASRLAELLVSGHLAACVNIAPVHSVFEWQGKLEKQAEWLLMLKSLKSRFPEIEAFIKNHHSYDLPEIIAIDILESSVEYSGWIEKICKSPAR